MRGYSPAAGNGRSAEMIMTIRMNTPTAIAAPGPTEDMDSAAVNANMADVAAAKKAQFTGPQ